MTTSEYVNVPVWILKEDAGDGYLQGDLMILDRTAINCPFFSDLDRATESLQWHKEHGDFSTLFLIETEYSNDSRYALIAY